MPAAGGFAGSASPRMSALGRIRLWALSALAIVVAVLCLGALRAPAGDVLAAQREALAYDSAPACSASAAQGSGRGVGTGAIACIEEQGAKVVTSIHDGTATSSRSGVDDTRVTLAVESGPTLAYTFRGNMTEVLAVGEEVTVRSWSGVPDQLVSGRSVIPVGKDPDQIFSDYLLKDLLGIVFAVLVARGLVWLAVRWTVNARRLEVADVTLIVLVAVAGMFGLAREVVPDLVMEGAVLTVLVFSCLVLPFTPWVRAEKKLAPQPIEDAVPPPSPEWRMADRPLAQRWW